MTTEKPPDGRRQGSTMKAGKPRQPTPGSVRAARLPPDRAAKSHVSQQAEPKRRAAKPALAVEVTRQEYPNLPKGPDQPDEDLTLAIRTVRVLDSIERLHSLQFATPQPRASFYRDMAGDMSEALVRVKKDGGLRVAPAFWIAGLRSAYAYACLSQVAAAEDDTSSAQELLAQAMYWSGVLAGLADAGNTLPLTMLKDVSQLRLIASLPRGTGRQVTAAQVAAFFGERRGTKQVVAVEEAAEFFSTSPSTINRRLREAREKNLMS